MDFPQAVRDHVHRHKNCEDIAMLMFIANYTRYKASLSSSSTDGVAGAAHLR
jgi:Glycosyl transferase family 64 domain